MSYDKFSSIIFTFMNLPRKMISSFHLYMENLFFSSLHSLLLQNWVPPFVLYILYIIQQLEIVFMLFDSCFANFWNSEIATNLKWISHTFYINRSLEDMPMSEISYYSCQLITILLIFFLSFCLQSRKASNSYLFLFLSRFILEVCRTIMIVPSLKYGLFSIIAPFKQHLNIFTPSDEDIASGYLYINSIISFVVLMVYLYFLTFIQLTYTDIRTNNESPFTKNPDLKNLYQLLFLIVISILKIFSDKTLPKYLILLAYITYSLYIISLTCSIILYFSSMMQISVFFFATLYLWTSIMMFMNVILNDGYNATIWFIGIFFIFGICYLNYPIIPKYPFSGHKLGVPEFLIFEGIATNLIMYSSRQNKTLMIIQGYIAHHHFICDIENCPIKRAPLFHNSLTGAEYMSKINKVFIDYINFLFNDQINNNYLNVDLRMRYCLFLFNFIKRNDLAVVELKLISQLEPSLQIRFVIYSLIRESIEKKIQMNDKETSTASNEIQKFWILRDCQSLNAEIERLSRKYIDFWTKVSSLSIDQDEMYSAAKNLKEDFAQFDSFWNGLHPLSSSKHPKSLIKSGLFISNVMNEIERGRKMIERGMILHQEITTRYRSFDAILYDMNLTEFESAIVVVSGNMEKPGIIRDINSNALMMFGYTREEVIGQNINALMTTEVKILHDDYIRTSVIRQYSVKFAKENILYAKNKNKFLVAVRALIKGVYQNETFFIAKVILRNKKVWLSEIIIDSKGYMETFSEPGIRMVGLCPKDIDQSRHIDSVLPDLSLYNRFIDCINPLVNVSLHIEDFEVTCKQWVYTNMKDPVYIFDVIKKPIHMSDEDITVTEPPMFAFVFDNQSNIILSGGNDLKLKSFDYQDHPWRENSKDSFAFGIKSAKLSKGKVINHPESSKDSIENLLVEDNTDRANTKIDLRIGLKSEFGIQSKVTEELVEKWIRDFVKETPLPASVKKIFNVVLLISIIFLFMVITGIIFQSVKYGRVNLLNKISQYFFGIKSSLMDIVSYVYYTMTLKIIQPSIVAWDPKSDPLFFEALEAGIQEIFENPISDSSEMLNIFNTPMFSFAGYETTKDLTYIEAVKALAIDAFVTINTDCSLIGMDSQVQHRMVTNIMNDFWSKIPLIENNFSQFEWKKIENISFLWYVFAIQIILSFFESLYILREIKKIHRKILLEQVLLTDIDLSKMKQKIRSIENFLLSMDLEISKNGQFESEEEDREKDVIFSSKKKILLKPTIQLMPFMIIILRFLVIVLIILIWLLVHFTRLNSFRSLFNERNSIYSFKTNYHYVLNSFYTVVYAPSFSINNTDSRPLLSLMISDLPSMDESLTVNHMLAKEVHSKEYNQFSQELLLGSGLDFLRQYRSSLNISNGSSECPPPFCSKGGIDYLSNGLTVGLTQFSQSLYTSVQKYLVDEKNHFENGEDCPAENKKFCFFWLDQNYADFLYVVEILKAFSDVWIEKVAAEMFKFVNSGHQIAEDTVFFTLLYCLIFMLLFMGSYLFYLTEKMKNVRGFLMIIPIESVVESPKLKEFFQIEILIKSVETE